MGACLHRSIETLSRPVLKRKHTHQKVNTLSTDKPYPYPMITAFGFFEQYVIVPVLLSRTATVLAVFDADALRGETDLAGALQRARLLLHLPAPAPAVYVTCVHMPRASHPQSCSTPSSPPFGQDPAAQLLVAILDVSRVPSADGFAELRNMEHRSYVVSVPARGLLRLLGDAVPQIRTSGPCAVPWEAWGPATRSWRRTPSRTASLASTPRAGRASCRARARARRA